MPRRKIASNVFDASLDRMLEIMGEGHRIVVSFSGGKDSGVCLEMTLMAAEMLNYGPIDVVMRDEEVMLPGTFDYCERVAARPEVNFHWLYANQPVINIFNRENPYFWVFDPSLPPEKWVRQPPEWAQCIPEKHIQGMITPERFPPPEGKGLVTVMGLRVSESKGRLYGLYSSGGYMTQANKYGVRYCRPIYDWGDGDVWKAHADLKWDYNNAYDIMHRLGRPRAKLRIAPPTMNVHGIDELMLASKGWPRWFDRVCDRLPGVRTAAQFGKRSCSADRRLNESWEECFQRSCINEAPEWIAERAKNARDRILTAHRKHAAMDLPQIMPCTGCPPFINSWKKLTGHLFNGDPFSMRADFLKYIEPEFFRPGAGTWGGTPSF